MKTIPLKAPSPATSSDLSKSLQTYVKTVAAERGISNDELSPLLSHITNLAQSRSNLLSSPAPEGLLEALHQYYSSVAAVGQVVKFADKGFNSGTFNKKTREVEVNWQWKESLNRDKGCANYNVEFEKLCLTFCIGAAYTFIAQTAVISGANDAEQYKVRAQNCLKSAGVFAHLLENSDPYVLNSSIDFSREVLSFFRDYMVAEAAAATYQNVLIQGKTPKALKQVAAGASERYKIAFEIMSSSSEPCKMYYSRFDYNFKEHLKYCETFFMVECQYYAAQDDLASYKHGEEISRLRFAQKQMESCAKSKFQVPGLTERAVYLLKKIQDRIVLAEKDNENIYTAIVPNFKDVEIIEPRVIGKPAVFESSGINSQLKVSFSILDKISESKENELNADNYAATLISMGYSEEDAKKALAKNNYDFNLSLEFLAKIAQEKEEAVKKKKQEEDEKIAKKLQEEEKKLAKQKELEEYKAKKQEEEELKKLKKIQEEEERKQKKEEEEETRRLKKLQEEEAKKRRKSDDKGKSKLSNLGDPDPALVLQLVDLGFDLQMSREALKLSQNDFVKALDNLTAMKEQKEGSRRKSDDKGSSNREPDPSLVLQLVDLGFDLNMAREALKVSQNDFGKALDNLAAAKSHKETPRRKSDDKIGSKIEAPCDPDPALVLQLVDLGFDLSSSKDALKSSKNDITKALDALTLSSSQKKTTVNSNVPDLPEMPSYYNSALSQQIQQPSLAEPSGRKNAQNYAESKSNLMAMGFSGAKVDQALAAANGDFSVALDSLARDAENDRHPTPVQSQPSSIDQNVRQLMFMGYDEQLSRNALNQSQGDLARAISLLNKPVTSQMHNPNSHYDPSPPSYNSISNIHGNPFSSLPQPQHQSPEIQQLVEMGFPRDKVIDALLRSNNNVEQALGLLM